MLDEKIYHKLVDGDIGIELELEGKLWYPDETGTMWNVVEDDSLRGGAEYVLRRPIKKFLLPKALEQLSAYMEKSKPKTSHRTSLHIHVNATSYTWKEVFQTLVLYWLMEGLLIPPHAGRKGNIFCLGIEEAPGAIDLVTSGISDMLYNGMAPSSHFGDHFRYGALNLNALSKFGSFEFRFLRATYDTDEISFWVNLLYKIVRKGQTYTSVANVLEHYDSLGAVEFVQSMLTKEEVSLIATHTSKDRWQEIMDDAYCLVYEIKSHLKSGKPVSEAIKYNFPQSEDL